VQHPSSGRRNEALPVKPYGYPQLAFCDSVREADGEQEGSTYNGRFDCNF